ncbi:MAG: hypothetical protein EAZ99_09015 [Alphaproteobacteria bacterium]|nr:MAG: hypothetical protein EAZ99_09015 [Alphaproteobacteria bacterium]
MWTGTDSSPVRRLEAAPVTRPLGPGPVSRPAEPVRGLTPGLTEPARPALSRPDVPAAEPFRSDLGPIQRLGPTLHGPDGERYSAVGGTLFRSDGRVCQQVGAAVICP